ncbi:MAG: hypothetical protein QOE70_995 [Chthoniobacter sp.]|jgi:glycosyltransferase involved in cell wall biosynthesis|nr:hypothetical protein [Chthoniobacter sp.]
MNVSPYFTVTIPVYNGELFIERAVASVVRQTCPDWALVVIDNQSTDGTWNILQARYANHPQIRLLQNASNLGMCGNFNRCLDEAAGSWIGILPADDTYAPHALETIYAHTRNEKDLILWIHSHLVEGAGVTPNICAVYPQVMEFQCDDLARLLFLRGNIFGELSSFFFNRMAVERHSLRFNSEAPSTDTRLWVRTAKLNPAGRARFWPDVLAHVWQHRLSCSSQNAASGESVADLFHSTSDLAELGWNRTVLLKQAARVLKCWWKFRDALPRNERAAPFLCLKKLLSTLCQAPPDR